MTITDLLTFVAGVAIALKLILPHDPNFRLNEPIDLFGFLVIIAFLVVFLEMATALVTLERQICYERPAHAAEWISILISLVLLLAWIPNLDTVGNQLCAQNWLSTHDSTSRGALGAAALLAILAGLSGLAIVGRWVPHWARTLLLAPLIAVWFWGPVEAVELIFPQRTIGSSAVLPRWLLWLYAEAFNIATSLPRWLPFGIPAVTALLELRNGTRRWIWSEWVSAGSGLLLGLALLSLPYWPVTGGPSEEQIVLRIVMPFWILAVAGFSWVLSRGWAAIVKRRDVTATH